MLRDGYFCCARARHDKAETSARRTATRINPSTSPLLRLLLETLGERSILVNLQPASGRPAWPAASSISRSRWRATWPAIRQWRCRRSNICGTTRPSTASAASFPACRQSDLPDSAGWALEKVEITTHNGTHLDAPYHYHPTMDHALGAPEAVDDHRPGAARLVLPARREARLPAFSVTAMSSPRAMSKPNSSASATRCCRWRSCW